MNIDINPGHNALRWAILNGTIDQIIQKHFQFNINISTNAAERIHKVTEGRNDVFIGVHVRRTDYAHYRKEAFGLPIVNATYFMAAMEYYRKKHNQGRSNTKFLVVSDDLGWCRANLVGNDVHMMGGGSAMSDLALMSQCNHTIIDYGSYGVWGGLLAGGEVTIPQSTAGNSRDAAEELHWNMLHGF